MLRISLLARAGWHEKAILRLAASAERGSEHPLGNAIVQSAVKRGLMLVEPQQFEAITGQGIIAMVGKNGSYWVKCPLFQRGIIR